MRTGNLDATETEMDLTMDECLSIQRNMEWQANVLTKLFKALKDAKKHPHLMDGISEYDVDFAKNYFQDIAYACVTLATIAENAMGVLKSIEEEKT